MSSGFVCHEAACYRDSQYLGTILQSLDIFFTDSHLILRQKLPLQREFGKSRNMFLKNWKVLRIKLNCKETNKEKYFERKFKTQKTVTRYQANIWGNNPFFTIDQHNRAQQGTHFVVILDIFLEYSNVLKKRPRFSKTYILFDVSESRLLLKRSYDWFCALFLYSLGALKSTKNTKLLFFIFVDRFRSS